MIIQFNEALIKIFGNEIYEVVQNNMIQDIVSWIIDRNKREAVRLKSWLRKVMETPIAMETIQEIDLDTQMIRCLKTVKSQITYKRDIDVWKVKDKWQTPQETETMKTGDCEDGSLLVYALARKYGIPKDRMMLMCGDVTAGGHCWLAYRPTKYPLNWVFIDWCYYVHLEEVDKRDMYYVFGKEIHRYMSYTKENNYVKVDSDYKKLWFAFNEIGEYIKVENRILNQ